MAWLVAGLCLSAALCVLAARIFDIFATVRRIPRPALLALFLLAFAATLEAQKTNVLMQALHGLMQSSPRTVSDEEIARGWRLESISTDASASLEMPADASLVGNWHVHGARTSLGSNKIDFPGFSFPLGTNSTSSFWYFVDGRIRPTPRDELHEIRAAGGNMFAAPNSSRLWTAAEPDGSLVMTWERFFLGDDTNTTVSAQIRLCPNGDIVTRSNSVETVYRRVNPRDFDGDGIVNERDGNQYFYDGDHFGVGNPIPSGADTNAYYWLDLVPTGALGVAEIAVDCDGSSDLGDHLVIARTNEVCRVPLLAGATYSVQSDLPIGRSAVSTEYARIVTNSETSLTVSLPLGFRFERVETRGTAIYALRSSPVDVGATFYGLGGGCCTQEATAVSFTWNCAPDCQCGGAYGDEEVMYATASWEGYFMPFSWYARCPCYFLEQELLSRGVEIDILDGQGRAVEWRNPVLVGEPVVIEVSVGGDPMSAAEFADMFGGRIRLKARYADSGGHHGIADAPVPVLPGEVVSLGDNVFHVPVSATWLRSNGIVRSADDGVVSKTSFDTAIGSEGDSNHQDSDIFDENCAGRLYGRARGRSGGSAGAPIPEGECNARTLRSAGTATLVAAIGAVSSPAKQCQQQADVFYYSGHGDHDSAVLLGVGGPSVVSNHWHDVDVAVIAGCSVLDVGDRNGNYASSPASHSASPGLRWLAASGAGTLLGYAYKAPSDAQGGVEIARRWCSLRAGRGDVEAWMEANDCRSGHNACAMQRIDNSCIEYHYFMKRARLYWSRRTLTLQLEGQ